MATARSPACYGAADAKNLVTASFHSDNSQDAARAGEPAGAPAQFPGEDNLALLRDLAQLVARENLSELEVEDGDVRLTLRAPSALAPAAAHAPIALTPGALPPVALAEAPVGDDSAPAAEPLIAIEAPMVGVFYLSPSPNDPPFVEVGDRVEAGQTVGIIEAMKVFNEIISEVEGQVVEITAANAELVETGGTLLLIRP
jgi:acetyl-CoA carboxylase biotin carboxyl carrier protein